jgi:hypothetical protein
MVNNTGDTALVDVYPILDLRNRSMNIKEFDKENNGYIVTHNETKERLISNLYSIMPYPTNSRDFFSASFEPYSYGGFTGNRETFYNYIKKNDSLNYAHHIDADLIALHNKYNLLPGESAVFHYTRGVHSANDRVNELTDEAKTLLNVDLQAFADENVALFKNIPRIDFAHEDEKIVYLGAFNLARGCMLPPEGESDYNYYIFSRNPLWGWGHGHQVFHESLSMLAYAYLDPVSAQGSQRVYISQQGEDGLIAYRHGPRGPQDYPHKGMPTTSAPFFSWTNWEIYKISKDKEFLKDSYDSGVKYMEWLKINRDLDQDGLYEWGPYGIIENVRDWYNAVFQVSAERYLGVDKEDISDELECLDLSLMVVKEMRSLSDMAAELGDKSASDEWTEKADELSALINETMWDEEHEFFFHVDKENHTFEYGGESLKRLEIIGFLPLWAEAVSKERAELLVKKHLTNPETFWRKNGVPTLSAKDPWYNPNVDQCCKWNGPVWLLWDYMVFHGLKNYGYDELAAELADKMMRAVSVQLSKNHNFWESFSPDNDVLNCPSNYIWDSIMARVLIDVHTQ